MGDMPQVKAKVKPKLGQRRRERNQAAVLVCFSAYFSTFLDGMTVVTEMQIRSK